ncbi:MAG: KEOPS complex subunit Pcc1 [Methanophagales archaeon]|nr:KEOPS complex subunit Pcc1 [Methanophagales archaeon]MCW3141187.1 KEOPS complex subunit Pcc1 [Methanophagales archaeon]
MGIKAEFVLEDEEETIKTVYESIKEEKENKTKLEYKDKDRRFFVDVTLKEGKLNVCINGDDIVKVRAAANTWLRLLKIAEEMVQVVRECDSHGF